MPIVDKLISQNRTYNKIRKASGAVFLAWLLAEVVIHKLHLMPFIIGACFVLSGEALRVWALGYIKKSHTLTAFGPYRYLRHPLYAGNFLIGFGFVLMPFNIVVSVLFLTLFFIIYSKLVQSEELLLAVHFKHDYDDYIKQVPRFIPKLKGGAYTAEKRWNFELRNLVVQREYYALSIILCLLLFCLLNLI